MNTLTPDQEHDLLAAAGRIVRINRDPECLNIEIRMAAALNNLVRVMERIAPEYIDGWANSQNEPAY